MVVRGGAVAAEEAVVEDVVAGLHVEALLHLCVRREGHHGPDHSEEEDVWAEARGGLRAAYRPLVGGLWEVVVSGGWGCVLGREGKRARAGGQGERAG